MDYILLVTLIFIKIQPSSLRARSRGIEFYENHPGFDSVGCNKSLQIYRIRNISKNYFGLFPFLGIFP